MNQEAQISPFSPHTLIQNAAFGTMASPPPVWLLTWEHALSRRPSSACTNEDFGALLSLHGGRYKPHVKCLPKEKKKKEEAPVTVPTDEPDFLCSAS